MRRAGLTQAVDDLALAAAAELLRGRERGSTLAVVACDSGLKYLSTDLWE